MNEPKTLFSNIGLRHVLEDTIVALRGRSLDQSRREYVINDVLQLLRDAERGSQIASQRSLFIRANDEPALMRLSLIDRYLDFDTRGELVAQLNHVSTTLDAILRNQQVAEDARDSAIQFLEQFKQNLRRRGSMESFMKTEGSAELY